MVNRYFDKGLDILDNWCFGIARRHPLISALRILFVFITSTTVLCTLTLSSINACVIFVSWVIANGWADYLLSGLIVFAVFWIFIYPSLVDRKD